MPPCPLPGPPLPHRRRTSALRPALRLLGCSEQAAAAVTAACAVQDKVDAACFWLRQQLQLGEESNVRLLAAAAAHVRTLQRRQQAEVEAQRRQQAAEEQQERELQRIEAEQEGAAADAGQQPEEREEQQAEGQQQDAGTGEVAVGDASRAECSERQEDGPGPAEPSAAMPPHPPAPEQQERGQQPDASAAAAQQRQQRQVVAAAHRLRRQLCWLLAPAMRQRLPPPPAALGGTAWQVLQEAVGRLSAAAAAACGWVVAEMDFLQGMEGAAGWMTAGQEQRVEELAARCLAAFEEGGGS